MINDRTKTSQEFHDFFTVEKQSIIPRSRLKANFKNKPGEICFDHMKSVYKEGVIQILGTLENNLRKPANELLREMFSEE